MPVIMVSNIAYDVRLGYHFSLNELYQLFPHLEIGKEIELYLVELRNERGKLVKRFKPFQKLRLKIDEHSSFNFFFGYDYLLRLPENIVSQFGVGKGYKMIIVITRYDKELFLPFEMKAIGNEAEKVLESFSKFEVNLFLLTLNQTILNKACSFLLDAYLRLDENDVEGSRTALRNCIEILEKEFLPKMMISEAGEEVSRFKEYFGDLLKAVKNLLHYGGPHPGPAPKSTTEMIVSLITELLKYLTKALDEKLIILKER